MEIKTITYKRIKNLGNYETEHMEMTAEIAVDDDVDQCAKDLKNYVLTALELVNPDPQPQPESVNYDEKPF